MNESDKQDQQEDEGQRKTAAEGPEPGSEKMQDLVHEAEQKAQENVEEQGGDGT